MAEDESAFKLSIVQGDRPGTDEEIVGEMRLVVRAKVVNDVPEASLNRIKKKLAVNETADRYLRFVLSKVRNAPTEMQWIPTLKALLQFIPEGRGYSVLKTIVDDPKDPLYSSLAKRLYDKHERDISRL